MLSSLYLRVKAQQYFVSSSYTFVDKKTVIFEEQGPVFVFVGGQILLYLLSVC